MHIEVVGFEIIDDCAKDGVEEFLLRSFAVLRNQPIKLIEIQCEAKHGYRDYRSKLLTFSC